MELSRPSLLPIHFAGDGGTLITDASSTSGPTPTPNTTLLSIDQGAVNGDGVTRITGNGGFETTTFSGFGGLVVRGGGGSETINLVTIDSTSSLSAITLDGDNLGDSDSAADTLQVQSTSGLAVTLTLLGGAGNDTFRILNSAPSQTIDAIAGQILISPIGTDGPTAPNSPTAGLDTLIVSDIGGTVTT